MGLGRETTRRRSQVEMMNALDVGQITPAIGLCTIRVLASVSFGDDTCPTPRLWVFFKRSVRSQAADVGFFL